MAIKALRNTSLSRFSHVIPVAWTDLTSLSTVDGADATLDLAEVLPDRFIVNKAAVFVETAFANAGTGAAETLGITVGTDGDADAFCARANIKSTGVTITGQGAHPTTLAGSFGASGDTIRIVIATGTGAKLSEITAGRLYVLLDIIDLSDLTKNLVLT